MRQAQREMNAGVMSQEEYQACRDICNDRSKLRELNERIENDVNPANNPETLAGADWQTFLSNLIDWFIENWPKILEIIMTIAPLFAEDRDERHS